MSVQSALERLVSLLDVIGDGQFEFEARVKRVENSAARTIVAIRAEEYETSGREMRALLTDFGVSPLALCRCVSAPSGLHLVGPDLVSDAAVLHECEGKEAYVVRCYERALSTDLPIEARVLVLRHLSAARLSLHLIQSFRQRMDWAG